jgi:hypothetical protein
MKPAFAALALVALAAVGYAQSEGAQQAAPLSVTFTVDGTAYQMALDDSMTVRSAAQQAVAALPMNVGGAYDTVLRYVFGEINTQVRGLPADAARAAPTYLTVPVQVGGRAFDWTIHEAESFAEAAAGLVDRHGLATSEIEGVAALAMSADLARTLVTEVPVDGAEGPLGKIQLMADRMGDERGVAIEGLRALGVTEVRRTPRRRARPPLIRTARRGPRAWLAGEHAGLLRDCGLHCDAAPGESGAAQPARACAPRGGAEAPARPLAGRPSPLPALPAPTAPTSVPLVTPFLRRMCSCPSG